MTDRHFEKLLRVLGAFLISLLLKEIYDMNQIIQELKDERDQLLALTKEVSEIKEDTGIKMSWIMGAIGIGVIIAALIYFSGNNPGDLGVG